MRPNPWLGAGLLALAAALVAHAILGPLVTGAIGYHVSEDMLNQVRGGDAAVLILVAPWSALAGLLAWRGHRAAPVLALAPAAFAVYLVSQLAIGGEFDRYPGNSGRYFPLFLGVVVLAGALLAASWWALDARTLPPLSRRASRIAGGALVGVAVFLVVGLHLPGLLDAWSEQPEGTEYLENPTVFWVVKLMDLGIIAPVALATGVGLWRGRAWARKPAYAVTGWFALLGAAVTGMAIVMLANDDPAASIGLAAGFGVFAALFFALAAWLYRPLFALPPAEAPPPFEEPRAPEARLRRS